MKDIGDYSIEIERAGLKVRASARGLVALLSLLAFVAVVTYVVVT